MTGVVGVCRVLSYFWEMVPAAVIKSLLIRLIRDLAWDASAIGVRVAVLQVYRVDIELTVYRINWSHIIPWLCVGHTVYMYIDVKG